MNQAEWYYAQVGQQFGPITVESLRHLVSTGRIHPHDLIRRTEMAQWHPASQLDELLAVPSDSPKMPFAPPPLPSSEPTVIRPPLPRIKQRDEESRRRERPTSKPSKTTLIVAGVAGATLFLCLGCCGIAGFIGSQDRARQRAEQEAREREASDAAQKELAAADGLWASAKKSEGSQKYRVLLSEKQDKYLTQADRGRVYSRLIDFEYESKNPNAGRDLIESAEKKGVTLQVTQKQAKSAVGAIQAERAHLAAEQAERDRIAAAKRAEEERLARRSPEEKLRDAKSDEIFNAVRFCSEFAENSVAANGNYKNKICVVEGVVFSVEDGPVIMLCDANEEVQMSCHLSKDAAKSPALRGLSRGKLVRVIGKCYGKVELGYVIDGRKIIGVKMGGCDFVPVSP